MKRLRMWLWLCLGVVLAGAAAFLLWPTVDWYLAASPDQREAATGSLNGMSAYVEKKTAADIAELLAADPREAIPRQFRYLVPLAAGHLRKLTGLPASRWRLGGLLGEYPDRSLLESDISGHHWTQLEGLRDRSRRVLRFERDQGEGVQLVVKADFQGLERSTGTILDETGRQAIIAKAIDVLKTRMREWGLGTLTVRQVGFDRILLRIPGTRDIERVRWFTTAGARLTFNLADTDSLAWCARTSSRTAGNRSTKRGTSRIRRSSTCCPRGP